QEEVKGLTEHGRVEGRVMVEAWPFCVAHTRLQEIRQPQVHSIPPWLDTAVAPGREKVDQPVPAAEHAAAKVQHRGALGEAEYRKGLDLPPTAILEAFEGHAQKAAHRRHALGPFAKGQRGRRPAVSAPARNVREFVSAPTRSASPRLHRFDTDGAAIACRAATSC